MSTTEDFLRRLRITADEDDDDVLVIGIDFGTTSVSRMVSDSCMADNIVYVASRESPGPLLRISRVTRST